MTRLSELSFLPYLSSYGLYKVYLQGVDPDLGSSQCAARGAKIAEESQPAPAREAVVSIQPRRLRGLDIIVVRAGLTALGAFAADGQIVVFRIHKQPQDLRGRLAAPPLSLDIVRDQIVVKDIADLPVEQLDIERAVDPKRQIFTPDDLKRVHFSFLLTP